MLDLAVKKKDLKVLPKTTKEDKKNHGMELFNVQKAVEKCNSIFKWNCNGERFQVKLILPLKQKGEEKSENSNL